MCYQHPHWRYGLLSLTCLNSARALQEKEINDARERQLEEALTNFLDSERFPNPAPTPHR